EQLAALFEPAERFAGQIERDGSSVDAGTIRTQSERGRHFESGKHTCRVAGMHGKAAGPDGKCHGRKRMAVENDFRLIVQNIFTRLFAVEDGKRQPGAAPDSQAQTSVD